MLPNKSQCQRMCHVLNDNELNKFSLIAFGSDSLILLYPFPLSSAFLSRKNDARVATLQLNSVERRKLSVDLTGVSHCPLRGGATSTRHQ